MTNNATVQLGPHSRATVKANDFEPNSEVSIYVSSYSNDETLRQPIVAERAMYFQSNGITGGSQAVGAPATGLQWYFAEGYTGPGFDEYICLYNPFSTVTPSVRVELMDEMGAVKTGDYTLPEMGRVTVHVNDLMPGKSVSATVTSLDGNKFVAERSMYFNYSGGTTGGSVASGVNSPNRNWYFAEGYSGD